MKTLSALLLTALFFSAAQAQVPGLMNYQGQVTDAAGAPLATGTHTMHFRVYDAASGGNLIWGPQSFDGTAGTGKGAQVPVVGGFFNVILGPQDTTARNFTDAFNGATRYLEIQVGVNPAISPRQQILSAPFALKANQVADNAIIGASLADNAVGNAELLDNAVNTAEIVDHAVTSAKIADNAVGNADLADNAVGSAEIANGSIQSADLNASISNSLWTAIGADVARNAGNVRISTGTLYLRAASDTNHGLGWRGSGKEFAGLNVDGPALFGYDGGVLGATMLGETSVLRWLGNGRVGIGTADPQSELHVRSTGNTSTLRVEDGFGRYARHDSQGVYAHAADGSGAILTVNYLNGPVYMSKSGSTVQTFGNFHCSGTPSTPSGAWTVSSDARLKKNIKPIQGSLQRLLALRSVEFEFVEPRRTDHEDRVYTGFIAQEVENVFPEWVSADTNGFKRISLQGFESQTVQALRELRAEKDAQLRERDARIAALEKKIAGMETSFATRLSALEKALQQPVFIPPSSGKRQLSDATADASPRGATFGILADSATPDFPSPIEPHP